MKILLSSSPSFRDDLKPLLQRSAFDPAIDAAVAPILADIRREGDAAVARYAAKFDHADLTPDQFRVPDAELDQAEAQMDEETKTAIRAAVEHVGQFSRQRLPQPWSFSPRPDVTLGEKFAPLDRVACYIPGGTAPLVSTTVHTAAIAAAAGVREICVITPPGPGGRVNPAILFACRAAGVTEVYRLGGVYGIAAMGYGTQTIRKAEKIVGPGNAYVTAAKRLMYGEVALDLVAGPSEIMIIADHTASPAYIAADLLSQAEHGSGYEKSLCVCTSAPFAEKIRAEVLAQTKTLSRRALVERVIDRDGILIVVAKDVAEGLAVVNAFAPEHFEIMTKDALKVMKGVRSAGAVFAGAWTPESAGDFVAGPSHVLPTGGAANMFSGLTPDDFRRRHSFVAFTRDDLAQTRPTIEAFAAVEGLDGHGRAATVRFE